MSNENGGTYAAGWYPDVAVPGTERYYDGTQWTTQTRPVAAAAPATTPVFVDPATGTAPAKTKKPWYKRTPVLIGGGVLALFIIIGAIGSANGSGKDDTAAGLKPAATEEAVSTKPSSTPTPKDERRFIPDLVGKTVGDARAAVTTLGFTLVTDQPDNAVISAQDVTEGERADAGTAITVVAAVPLTLAQENVVRQAKNYLEYTAFSRQGLIDQLEYEGYSTEDATFGADNAGADWNVQAGLKAKSYLEYTSFSRDGLADQLRYEGFSESEIAAGLAAVGY